MAAAPLYSGSTLSTPELTPSSTLSSNDSTFLLPSPSTSTDDSGSNSPFVLKFASRVRTSSMYVSVKNLATSVHGTKSTGSLKEPWRPHQRRPTPLPLVDPFDVAPPLNGVNGSSVISGAPPAGGRGRSTSVKRGRFSLLRRESSRPSTHGERITLQRVSSLPSISSATFVATKNEDTKVIVEQAVRSDTKKEPEKKIPKLVLSHPADITRDRNTNAMASLAWTGTLPSALPSSFPIVRRDHPSSTYPMNWPLNSASHSNWSLTDSIDQSLDSSTFSLDSSPSNDQYLGPLSEPNSAHKWLGGGNLEFRPHRRRWTLAMVITDDHISDEKLVDKLEQMVGGQTHENGDWSRHAGVQSPVSPPILSAAIPSSVFCVSPREANGEEVESDSSYGDSPSSPHNRFSDPSVWKTARRTLLICRELVRTERSYLASLRTILSEQTSTSSPVILRAYIPALIKASEYIVSQMEINPSAVGVAEAFLSGGEQLELAFVPWCGVVGEFFAGTREGAILKRARTSSASFPGTFSEATMSNIGMKRRVGSWSKRISSMSRRGSREDGVSRFEGTGRSDRDLRFRELAILPTQRVMRYTLLFKDLVSYTPSSSVSQKKVQDALDVALSLAQKCDKAQGNSTFLYQPR